MLRKIDDNISKTKIGRLTNRLLSFFELAILKYYKGPRVNFIKKIMKEDKGLLFKPSELFMIRSLAKSQTNIDGDYVEVGVFKGSSAKVICDVKDRKNLYLFDTFDGIPNIDKKDTRFYRKMFNADYDSVKKRLRKYSNVYIYKGVFPKTSEPIKQRKFAFVHLDVDTYQSTKDCLEFFYQRTNKEGIILSHDYSQAQGVKKAFDEFFKNKKEGIIELPMTQCMVIKR